LIATTNLPDPVAGKDKSDLRRTLAEHVGERARSRLFEMCTVVRIHHTEDYRLKKARTF
jgi:DNA replication protein DnaC